MKIAWKNTYNYANKIKFLTFEEYKGNNYVYVTVLAFYHQTMYI